MEDIPVGASQKSAQVDDYDPTEGNRGLIPPRVEVFQETEVQGSLIFM